MIVICVLCGLPGCGKTTLCQKLIQDKSKDIKYVHCCYDEYMTYVDHVQNDFKTWKENRRIILDQIVNVVASKLNNKNSRNIDRKFYGLFNEVINCDSPVIALLIDDNMFYRGMRKEYFNLCCEYEIGFCTIYMQCAIETCIKRNSNRQNPVLEETISKMSKQIEPPGNKKGKWEEFYILFSEETMSFEEDKTNLQIRELIFKAAHSPSTKQCLSQEAEFSRREICRSFKHQLDLIIRKYVNKTMSDAKTNLSKGDLQALFQNLNRRKQNLMSLIECGYINAMDYINESGNIIIELLQEKIFTIMEDNF